jgi:hypothetical protein
MVKNSPTMAEGFPTMAGDFPPVVAGVPTMIADIPTMIAGVPTMVEIDCSWIFILFNKLIIIFDHGRKGFANCFCLSANGFTSPTIFFVSLPKVFVFSPTAGRLRPLSLFHRPWSLCLRALSSGLRQRFPIP